MVTKSRGMLKSQKMNFVRSYKSKLSDLPPPEDGAWTEDDLPEYLSEKIRLLESKGIITRVESGRTRAETKWETPRNIWAALKSLGAFTPDPNANPCGHVGLRNVVGGDYECQTCDMEFTREEYEEARQQYQNGDSY